MGLSQISVLGQSISTLETNSTFNQTFLILQHLYLVFQDWQPPFAVEVDNFRFTPRIQRLNELEVSPFTFEKTDSSFMSYTFPSSDERYFNDHAKPV